MTDVTRRGLLRAAGMLSAGAALSGTYAGTAAAVPANLPAAPPRGP